MPPRRKKAARVVVVPRKGLVDDDSEEDSINDDGREERRRVKAVKRAEHLQQVTELRAAGLQQMSAAGMQQHRTEAVGDCWLIALLAGHEVDVAIIGGVSSEQRKMLLTPWRMKLAEFAPHMDTKGFNMKSEELGIEYLKKIAMYFGAPTAVIKACEAGNNWTKARDFISKALKLWKKPQHFGMYQEPVHVCMGVFLRKNILEIDIQSITQCATSMLPALLFLLRCAASPTHLLTFLTVCMHAQAITTCGRCGAPTASLC